MVSTWRTRCPLISVGDRQWTAWECRKMSISELKEYKNILLEKRDKRDIFRIQSHYQPMEIRWRLAADCFLQCPGRQEWHRPRGRGQLEIPHGNP